MIYSVKINLDSKCQEVEVINLMLLCLSQTAIGQLEVNLDLITDKYILFKVRTHLDDINFFIKNITSTYELYNYSIEVSKRGK